MDNKTWQQSNLGSTNNGRSLRTIQHQQLSSSATATIYPGSLSTITNQTGTHWQRISCCNGLNPTPNPSHSHLLSPRQQSSGNQISQHRQPTQLRYFQVQKSTNPQYSSRPSPSPSPSHNRPNQTHQNFSQPYALLTTQSALSPTPVSPSTNPSIPERSRHRKSDAISHIDHRLTDSFRSNNKTGTIAQTIPQKFTEETQFPHHSQNNNNNINNQSTNGKNNQQNFSTFGPTYQHRYHILANGHFAPLPAFTETSLTTCFALTGATPNGSESFVSPSTPFADVDDASNPPANTFIPTCHPQDRPGFVNAFEAVPDMMKNIRPGPNLFAPYPTNPSPSFSFTQNEFSYHAVKPTLTVGPDVTSFAPAKNNRDVNWPKLSLNNDRAIAAILRHRSITSITGNEKNIIWKKITTEKYTKEKTFRSTTRRSFKQFNCLSGVRKSYAAAVQLTGTRDTSEKNHRDRSRMSELTTSRLKIHESWNVEDDPGSSSSSSFETSTPKKMEHRESKMKRDHEDSCEDENGYTSTSSSATNDGIPPTSGDSSSPEVADTTNTKDISVISSPMQLSTKEDKMAAMEDVARGLRAPSRKKLCKMAESFCFGQLENAAFFRAFDEYNRRRRRMSYTQFLENGRRGFEGLERGDETIASMEENRNQLFGIDCSPRIQGLVYATLQQNGGVAGSGIGNVQFHVNGMENGGPFKVLQKLQECPDGNSAIYTNSWRPEELHFLRRCHQTNKM